MRAPSRAAWPRVASSRFCQYRSWLMFDVQMITASYPTVPTCRAGFVLRILD